MPARDEHNLSTQLYCRSTEEGLIAPDWDDTREGELQGQFEVGLTVANRYLLKKKLGDGSMGRVFLARGMRLDRSVAMKVVSSRHQSRCGDRSLFGHARLFLTGAG